MSQKQVPKGKNAVHDYERLMQTVHSLIEKELSEKNIKIIKKYDREMVRQSIALATRQKHLRTVLSLTRLVNKNWEDVTADDIDELAYKIMDQHGDESGQETNYSYDHKKILKIFYRWFKLGSREFKEVGDPEETKNIKMRKVRDKIAREDLLTEIDKTHLLQACGENVRDRALIDCHFEGGTRPGEILNLQIKHVKFDEHGAKLHVDGKTGARTVRLIRSVPSLASWLDVHPLKENPNSPLWILVGKRNFGEQMTYPAARAMVARRARIANLSKRVHLNLFRHSEATESAKFMTEAQMRARHGWSTSSKMPARYVHLVNADVDDAIFEHLGIKKTEENRLKIPLKCHVCEMPNSPDSTICSKCGKPLDIKTALEMEENDRQKQQMLEDKIARQEQAISNILEKIDRLKK